MLSSNKHGSVMIATDIYCSGLVELRLKVMIRRRLSAGLITSR